MKSNDDRIKSIAFWLEDHWWIIHRNRRYTLFEDPLTGDMLPLHAAKRVQVKRIEEGITVRPTLFNPTYIDRNFAHTTKIIDCTECDTIGCITCFHSGYLYFTESHALTGITE